MMRLWRQERNLAIVAAGGAAAALLLALFADTAVAVGLSLFRHVADSYLVMFIDSMGVAFICF